MYALASSGVDTFSANGILTMSFLAALLAFILSVFLVRIIALWYWKIDKIVALLENIEFNTRERTQKKESDNAPWKQ